MSNTSAPLPTLFVSHGSPMIALEPGATGAFFAALGAATDATFGRPRAIVALSAHTLARQCVLLAATRHTAVYDFGNFDERLFTLRYDVPGAPELAVRVQALLAAAGIGVANAPQGGLDHGIWTALRYLYPQADVPVLPLAWNPHDSPERLFTLGAALAPLAAEGVLVLGSGSITHNLRRVFEQGPHDRGQPEIAESRAFRSWIHERSAARDWDALFDVRRRAPHAVDMHPSDEHLLPWFIAAGAGGREHVPQRLFEAVTFGALGMDAYAFGAGASRLESAIIGA